MVILIVDVSWETLNFRSFSRIFSYLTENHSFRWKVTKTMKYQMAIRHRNKYRITMESNPPLPNLYSFTPLVFKTSYTFAKLNFYIPLVVQFLGNGWIRTKKIIFVYSATVHVLYNYFIIYFTLKNPIIFLSPFIWKCRN